MVFPPETLESNSVQLIYHNLWNLFLITNSVGYTILIPWNIYYYPQGVRTRVLLGYLWMTLSTMSS